MLKEIVLAIGVPFQNNALTAKARYNQTKATSYPK